MSDAVLYCDVMFTKTRERAQDSSSSLTETTYSEVNVSKMQPSSQPPAASQHVVLSNRGSKVRSERMALLVFSVLLIAAVIGLGVVSFYYLKIRDELQSIQEQFTGLKNLTEGESPKCDRCWALHGGKCYFFSIDDFTWRKSREECKDQGGDLVQIDSREEQKFLDETVRKYMKSDQNKFWIGLTDSEEEGKWVWVDGSPLNMSLAFWNQDEPSDYKGDNPEGEDCVRMGEIPGAADLKSWFDRSCKGGERYICEKPAGRGL